MAAVTFEEARQAVDEALGGERWSISDGTWYVAPWGYEDASQFSVIAGAREWIEGNDPTYQDLSDRVILVSKVDGVPRVVNALAMLDRLVAMTPVGVGHPDPEE